VLDVDDLRDLRPVRETRIASAGRLIAFSATGMDPEGDRYRSRIQVVDLGAGGRDSTPLAQTIGRAPRWSPDGRLLAYLLDAEAGGGCELRLLAVADWTSRALATFTGPTRGPVWSPDGRLLALEASPLPGSPGRIAIVAVETGSVRVLDGPDGEADSVPSWSPDGERLAFARAVAEGQTGSIHLAPAAAGEPSPLPTDLAFATSPSWSPGGEMLACVGTAEPRLGSGDPCLQPWILSVAGGPARLAASGVNGVVVSPSQEGPVWSADERHILFREARRGDIDLVRASVAEPGPAEPLTGGSQVIDFGACGASGRLVFAATTAADPGSVFLLDDRGVRPLMEGEDAWRGRSGTPAPAAERRVFESPHGHPLDGWLTGVDPGRSPQPLLLALHGGPHAFVGSGFQHAHFYRNVLASRGWLVLSLNASGSGSYGEPFADRIRGRWGEYDLPEHLAAVEELVAEGLADPARLVAAGYSYGGYLAAWAACMDDRFRAAVVGAPITNLRSFERSSDIGPWYTPWEMKGGLPENEERYERLSPINHVDRIETPLLILHGEADRRCPLGQSLEFAERVEREGHSSVELVRYAGADHLFYATGRPSQRLDFNRRIVEWVERMAEEEGK
jgi:dipeptidyl aminopeptidase/acylaminoacyl peptidase